MQKASEIYTHVPVFLNDFWARRIWSAEIFTFTFLYIDRISLFYILKPRSQITFLEHAPKKNPRKELLPLISENMRKRISIARSSSAQRQVRRRSTSRIRTFLTRLLAPGYRVARFLTTLGVLPHKNSGRRAPAVTAGELACFACPTSCEFRIL